METADIITLIGIIITAVLAGANLVTAFFNQRQSQGYNLRMADYERRYVQLTDNVSQYISMLDAHWLSFMALNEEEYEGKDAEIYERYHQMETAHYKIKLLLSNENQFFKSFVLSWMIHWRLQIKSGLAIQLRNYIPMDCGTQMDFWMPIKKVLERKERFDRCCARPLDGHRCCEGIQRYTYKTIPFGGRKSCIISGTVGFNYSKISGM